METFIFLMLRDFKVAVDLCHDYSFWQTGRCSSNNDKMKAKMHPIFCNKDTIPCTTTWSNDTRTETNFCQGTANEESCNLKGWFFCNMSKTCIPQCKFSHIFSLFSNPKTSQNIFILFR